MMTEALSVSLRLPFDVVALAWERSHDVSKQGYVDFAVGSWLGLGAEFLFICIAIAIVMALARPLRRLWWLAAAPVFVGLALLLRAFRPGLEEHVGMIVPLGEGATHAQERESEHTFRLRP